MLAKILQNQNGERTLDLTEKPVGPDFAFLSVFHRNGLPGCCSQRTNWARAGSQM